MKVNADSKYVGDAGQFATVISPSADGCFEGYESEPVHGTHQEAVIAGIRYLESRGLRFDWSVVAKLVYR